MLNIFVFRFRLKAHLRIHGIQGGDQRVAHVTVSTAQGENDSSTSATIQIVFAGPLDVEGDGGSKEKGAGDGAA